MATDPLLVGLLTDARSGVARILNSLIEPHREVQREAHRIPTYWTGLAATRAEDAIVAVANQPLASAIQCLESLVRELEVQRSFVEQQIAAERAEERRREEERRRAEEDARRRAAAEGG